MKPSIQKLPSGSYLLKNVACAWPDLALPRPFKTGDKPRYGITPFIPDDAADVIEFLQKEIQALAQDRLKVKKLAEADGPLRDGNAKDNEVYHGFYQLSLYSYPNDKSSTKGKPAVVGRDGRTEIKPDSSDFPTSGTFCNVLFDLYTNSDYKKVSGGLKVVQRVQDGPMIGTGNDLSALPDLGSEPVADVEDDDDV